MSFLSRNSLAVMRRSGVMRSTPRQVRFAHEEHHRPHLPFTYDKNKKAAFTAKFLAFTGIGFSVPFIATYYQLWKSGSLTAQ
ncbi:unnamed protein product [Somion occarium]|uniref:Cytochrome c oxidase subunit 8, mitochondrial n=1 Tax=Somion occarium TaxID=3059160 RepID=A0ABP1CPY4_9APHY